MDCPNCTNPWMLRSSTETVTVEIVVETWDCRAVVEADVVQVVTDAVDCRGRRDTPDCPSSD
jgi:hypothetical protein